MNYCNFVKILCTRATKDTEAVKIWDTSVEEKTEDHKPKYDNYLNMSTRFKNYTMFVKGLPKLTMGEKNFKLVVPKIQTYLTDNKYWVNNNKNGEKKKYMEHFSVINWKTLPIHMKKQHKLTECEACLQHDGPFHDLLKSNNQNPTVFTACRQIMSKITPPSSKSNATKTDAYNAASHLVHQVQPAFEKYFNTDLQTALCKVPELGLMKKPTPEQTQKNNTTQTRKKMQQIELATKENNTDLINFLASGKSYSQHDRERLGTYFQSKEETAKKVSIRIEKEFSGELKRKNPIGKMENYIFDKDSFLTYISNKTEGDEVIWSKLAKEYNVTTRTGSTPKNGGQILMEYARSRNINILKFNKNKRISGRDYLRRIRRPKKKLRGTNISIPTPRTSTEIKEDIIKRIENGEFDIGELIAPKAFTKQKIDKSGKIITTTETVHGRKISLMKIRKETLESQIKAGILRQKTDEEYKQMSQDEIEDQLKKINEYNSHMSIEEQRQKLMKFNRTRHFKVWHDHSDIANHSHILFMVSFIYDTATYLTDEEYAKKFPDSNSFNVQCFVERPTLYILGRSNSTDMDQLLYTEERTSDLKELGKTLEINGTKIYDINRIFSGDGPARQFESGQQRGGNYSCLCGIHVKDHINFQACAHKEHTTLSEKQNLVLGGTLWKKMLKNQLNPFTGLKKHEIEEELEARGIEITNNSRADLQETLTETIHGQQRTPSLLFNNPEEKLDNINSAEYEVLASEPLHDITNVVQNFIQEIPHHFENQLVSEKFRNFHDSTIGNRSQVKGADARLFAVKLVIFAQDLYEEDKISDDMFKLLSTLCEISQICYSDFNKRTPRQILRLFNLTFILHHLSKSVIGNPKKMTNRKFYGSHFHSLTIHTAEIYRILCLKSTIPEYEERTFGDIRKLTITTSNRQPQHIIGNAILRLHAQQKVYQSRDSVKLQTSMISKQANFLPPFLNTTFDKKFIQKHQTLFQAHFKRISNYLLLGENVWWRQSNEEIEFLDCSEEPDFREGPDLHHYRSSSLKMEEEYIHQCWMKCIERVKGKEIILPIEKIKCYDINGLLDEYLTTNGSNNDEPSEIQKDEQENDNQPDINIEDEETDQHIKFIYSHEEDEIEDDDENSNLQNTDETTENRLDKDIVQPELTMDIEENDNSDKENDDLQNTVENEAELGQPRKYPIEVNIIITEKQKMEKEPGKRLVLHKTNEENYCQASKVTSLTTKDDQMEHVKAQPMHNVRRSLFKDKSEVESQVNKKAKSMIEQLTALLGPTSEIDDYKKYCRLSQMEPSNKMFLSKKDVALAKIQTQMLKKHSTLKEQIKQFDIKYMKENDGGLPGINDYKLDGEIFIIYRQKHLVQKYIKYWGMDCF